MVAEIEYWEHWYEVSDDGSLRQGDVLRDLVCYRLSEALRPPAGDSDPKENAEADVVEWIRRDWVILTPSCDLQQGRVPGVILAEVHEVTRTFLGYSETAKEYNTHVEVIRRGRDPTKFLLPEHPNLVVQFPLSVILLRNLVFMPPGYLEGPARAPHIRLRHPYREKLANTFAALLSDVGPEDAGNIPRLASQVRAKHIIELVDE